MSQVRPSESGMPPLPEQFVNMFPCDLERFQGSETYATSYSLPVRAPDLGETEPLFTADQMRAYAQLVAEDCAKVCETQAERFAQASLADMSRPYASHECAAAIRAKFGAQS